LLASAFYFHLKLLSNLIFDFIFYFKKRRKKVIEGN